MKEIKADAKDIKEKNLVPDKEELDMIDIFGEIMRDGIILEFKV